MTTEERLEKLERELARANRHNRWLLAGVVLAIVGLSLAWTWTKTTAIAQAQGLGTTTKVIRANEFILEDENHKPRASLGATKDGAKLSLYDKNGKGGVMLGATKDGANLSLYDENRKARGMLSVNKGGAGLRLCGPDGETLWSAP